jgi:hypothetical protein
VLRDGKTCKAEYINLAVVRELESCLSQFLDNVCERAASGVYLTQSKIQAHQLLERILNQNEQSLGLFYLHPDVDTTGIADCAVALLRVNVAFRAKEHYRLLQRARKGRLTAEFRSKLGWLVGNLYSRVGTRDWADTPTCEKEMRQLIHRLIDSDLYLWVTKPSLTALRGAGVLINEVSFKDLPTILEKHMPVPFKDEIAKAAMAETEKVMARIADEVIKRLDNSTLLPRTAIETVAPEIRSILQSVLADIPGKIRNRLISNPVVSRAVNRDEPG